MQSSLSTSIRIANHDDPSSAIPCRISYPSSDPWMCRCQVRSFLPTLPPSSSLSVVSPSPSVLLFCSSLVRVYEDEGGGPQRGRGRRRGRNTPPRTLSPCVGVRSLGVCGEERCVSSVCVCVSLCGADRDTELSWVTHKDNGLCVCRGVRVRERVLPFSLARALSVPLGGASMPCQCAFHGLL